MKIKSYILNEKKLTFLICIIGIVMVSYGMIKDNNVIFIIGLIFVVGGYLIFRKKLKEAAQDRS